MTALEQRRPMFTVKTLAAYLALDVTTVERLLRAGTIPSFKLTEGRPGARRIDPADVDAYLAERRQ
jgi:excisionase family DNA binding protein